MKGKAIVRKKKNLVMCPKGVPDIKMDRPTDDRRSQNQLNSTQLNSTQLLCKEEVVITQPDRWRKITAA
jgi:hypothetical protein